MKIRMHGYQNTHQKEGDTFGFLGSTRASARDLVDARTVGLYYKMLTFGTQLKLRFRVLLLRALFELTSWLC